MQVRWCRNKSAKPAALQALFAPSASRPDAAPLFLAVMEHCRTSDRAWMDWLLKQYFYDDEQVRGAHRLARPYRA